MREAVNPATGNYMAMAVAHALADADLHGDSDVLERLTAAIKRGIQFAGLLHMKATMSMMYVFRLYGTSCVVGRR